MAKKPGVKSITRNRRAYHDYFIDEVYEAGLELFGTEVKSIRLGTVSLRDAFCNVKDGQLFCYGMHISPYEKGNIFNRDPDRPKRLLMHKREIMRLGQKVMQDGLTLVPTEIYLKDSLVKVQIGLARGKKLYDKRESAAKRDMERAIQRGMREAN